MSHSFSEFAQELTAKYHLEPVDIYFLDLIPLIEMMWADNQVQDSEIEILMSFADEMMAKIEAADKDSAISKDDIIRFIERYTNTQPKPELLSDLRNAALRMANLRSDPQQRANIITYCIDIAAACVPQYPYDTHDRINKDEKALLLKIISALDISADTTIELTSV